MCFSTGRALGFCSQNSGTIPALRLQVDEDGQRESRADQERGAYLIQMEQRLRSRRNKEIRAQAAHPGQTGERSERPN